MYLVFADGESIHFECAKTKLRSIVWSMRHDMKDEWRVIGCDINYEDNELRCVYCGERIESAYGEEESA